MLVNRRVARVPTAAGAPKATAATPAAPAGNRPVPRSVAVPTLAGLVELAIEPATAALLGCAAGPARLARAWPRRDGSLAVELRDAHGAVLAGQWRADPDDVRGIARQTTAAGPGGCAVVATAGGRWFVLQVRADRRLPGLATALGQPGAALVGHRAEQRAVVRVHGAHVKVTRPQRAAAAAVAAQHAADLARTAGRATAALHAAAVPAGTPVHGAARETGVLERWLALLTPHAPALAGRVTARAAPVARALLDVSAAVPVLLHRDLHDGQILVDASGAVALLDLDTLAAGEAALDVANLLVHLELAALQGRCAPERAAAAGTAFLDGYGESPPSDRLVAHADAAPLRLVCVHAFRPAPEGLLDALVERLDAPAPGVDAR